MDPVTPFLQQLWDQGNAWEPYIQRAICGPHVPRAIIFKTYDADPRIACSPDAIDFVNRRGYEFKTKVKGRIPNNYADITEKEYLQAQMCLALCRDATDSWMIGYYAPGHKQAVGFVVHYDDAFWINTVYPLVKEFCDKIDDIRQEMLTIKNPNTKALFEKYKYGPWHREVRSVNHMALYKSIDTYVQSVDPEYFDMDLDTPLTPTVS